MVRRPNIVIFNLGEGVTAACIALANPGVDVTIADGVDEKGLAALTDTSYVYIIGHGEKKTRRVAGPRGKYIDPHEFAEKVAPRVKSLACIHLIVCYGNYQVTVWRDVLRRAGITTLLRSCDEQVHRGTPGEPYTLDGNRYHDMST